MKNRGKLGENLWVPRGVAEIQQMHSQDIEMNIIWATQKKSNAVTETNR